MCPSFFRRTTGTDLDFLIRLFLLPTASLMATVTLNPVPGFCVKSRTTNDASVQLASDQPRAIRAEKGVKIFVNIAWDPNVPPPPPGSDEAIHRAVQGLDIDESNPEAWFIPIVLSDARQDSDKGECYFVFRVHRPICPYVISISDEPPPLHY